MLKPLLSVEKIWEDFPLLKEPSGAKRYVYLDSAATTLRPKSVVERVSHFSLYENANVHRGAYPLSAQATVNFEKSREGIARFVNARDPKEIIFTKGATESINLAAYCLAERFLRAGDEIVLSEMEHHSNLVPWQIVAKRIGCQLKFLPIDERGNLKIELLDQFISKKTRLVAITHCSNTLGTIVPVKEIIKFAHSQGALVLVDGAQGIQSMPVDVQDLDCDFYAFSGHKLFGSFGTGVLYGKSELLAEFAPYQSGGGMIAEVFYEQSSYGDLPFRFEAGTPNISGVISLLAALEYIESLGMKKIFQYKQELLRLATLKLMAISGLKIIGQADQKTSIISFVMDGIHPQDIGEILAQENIAVRTGHHCTQPLLRKLGLTSTVRASFSIYNTPSDVDRLCEGLKKVQTFFKS